MMNYLSEHFSMEEMTRSRTATVKRIDNTPSDAAVRNLKILCTQVLEPARAKYGRPIVITSGYRCAKLNAAVGGVPKSYHTKGMAADIRIDNIRDAYNLAKLLNDRPLTDLILIEHSSSAQWLHVQWSRYPRHRVNFDYKV